MGFPLKIMLTINIQLCKCLHGGQGGNAVQPMFPLDLRLLPSLFPRESETAKWSLGFQTLTFANCDSVAFSGAKIVVNYISTCQSSYWNSRPEVMVWT